MEPIVRDNPERRRYELVIDDRIVSIAEYRLDGDVVVVAHVETDAELRGRGNADLLMRGMLDDLRAHGRRVLPLCPFATVFLHQHPDDSDLVAS